MQHGAPADGAAHDHGPFQFERIRDGHHRLHIGVGGEPVHLPPEAFRRRGLAVPGQVEGDDAEARRHLRVVQYMAVLPPVAAGRVQAEQRRARPRFLEIEPVRAPADAEPEIAPGHRLQRRRGGRRGFRAVVLQAREQHLQQQQVALEFRHVARHDKMLRAAHGGHGLEARRRIVLAKLRPGFRGRAHHEVRAARSRRPEADAVRVYGDESRLAARAEFQRERPEAALQGDLRVGMGAFRQIVEHGVPAPRCCGRAERSRPRYLRPKAALATM